MLGVLPEYRDAGIGRRLKLRQRDDALARGIELIEWTFDPLELKNAYFNMERLGAIVRRYHAQSVRHHDEPSAWRAADGPLHGGMVDGEGAGAERCGRRDVGARMRTWKRGLRAVDLRIRRAMRRAREIQAEEFETVASFRARAGGDRVRADAERDDYLLGRWE